VEPEIIRLAVIEGNLRVRECAPLRFMRHTADDIVPFCHLGQGAWVYRAGRSVRSASMVSTIAPRAASKPPRSRQSGRIAPEADHPQARISLMIALRRAKLSSRLPSSTTMTS